MDGGQCGATVNWTSPTATDNCDGNFTATQSSGASSGSVFTEGTHTVEYEASDSEGNTSDCSFTVTVQSDGEKPNFDGTCANYPNVFNTDVNQCFATLNFLVPNPSDNCGIVELKAKIWNSNGNVVQNWTTNPDGSFQPDTYEIKWRAKDAANNKKTCATNFTIQDSEIPVAQCLASHVVQLSVGIGTLIPADIDSGSSDNCAMNFSLSKSNFDCNDRGNTTVTLTVTDNAGNMDQCTTNIEVLGTTLSIDDVSQNEGNGTGHTFFFFKIERASNGCTSQVDYETTDGGATISDGDYVYGSGTSYYPPGGSNIRYVICRANKDSKFETDENFWVELSNPSVGLTFTKDKGEANLLNDDTAPLIGNPYDNSNTLLFENQSLEGKIGLYSNPTIRDLNISIDAFWMENRKIQVELYDVLGSRLSSFEMSENHTVVDVSALFAGAYWLTFSTKNGKRISKKFVKVD